LDEQLRRLALHLRDNALLADAERGLGWCMLCQGSFDSASEWLEQSAERATHNDAASPASSGVDTRVLGLSNLAILSTLRDGVDEAAKRVNIAVVSAQACSKPLAVAYGYGCAAIASMLINDEHSAYQFAVETEKAAAEYGLVYRGALAQILRGWSEARSGNRTFGLANLREGLARYRKTESLVLLPVALMMLADAEAEMGAFDHAFLALDEGESVIQAIGARGFKCLLLLARARLLVRTNDRSRASDAAEYALREAVVLSAGAVAGKAREFLSACI
jgi:hypothetical protein